jgi:hypothetical protein
MNILRPRPLSALPLILLLSLVSCMSARERHERELAEADLGPIPSGEVRIREDLAIGHYLTELDSRMQHWFQLKLVGDAESDRLQDVLGVEIGRYAGARQEEILFELEHGPVRNRMIAAAGLGFTGDDVVLGPLLGALEDSDPQVRRQAVLGLGLLGSPDTPLDPLLDLLRGDADGRGRNNAAFALFRLARAGVRSPDLADALRLALLDSEATVRAQAAVTLGVLIDPGAVDDLGALLTDQLPVQLAASRALLQIARDDLSQRGPVARQLLEAWRSSEGSRRGLLRRDLVVLAGVDYGERTEDWDRWASGLP